MAIDEKVANVAATSLPHNLEPQFVGQCIWYSTTTTATIPLQPLGVKIST